LKSASRRLNRIRREVYREHSVATGETGRATALALWRAVTKKGFRAWCYEFGFSDSLTHAVTIVEADDALRIHDAFFNLTYRLGFHEVLDALRDGRPVAAKIEIRDRKIYVMDPAFEPQSSGRWLETNAERELAPVDGRRQFEVLWNEGAFAAVVPGVDAAYRELEARGYPRDLRFLMLHPIEMFDGEKSYRDTGDMPLLAGHDLDSPLAALRVRAMRADRELASERERAAERDAIISRLEGERDAAKSGLAEAAAEVRRLSDQVVQLRAALDDENARFTAEREALQQAVTEARAQSRAYEAEIADAISELSRVRAEWNAERRAWECDLTELRAAAGMWIEQSSDALRMARSERDAAFGEREQAAADRDHARAELSARLEAWENTPWRRFRALVSRAFGKRP
jgi:predicted  nucleic acid-binding Zn-ribbon protein